MSAGPADPGCAGGSASAACTRKGSRACASAAARGDFSSSTLISLLAGRSRVQKGAEAAASKAWVHRETWSAAHRQARRTAASAQLWEA